jgi:hypothetical protein
MTPLLLLKKMVAKYVLKAMTTWVPIANQVANGEEEMAAKQRYEEIASDIVDAVYDEDEPAVFSGVDGKLKTALEVVAIPSYESGFQKIVDDGTCNQPSFKADRRGNCDGKTAFTLWQIHSVGNGLMFSGTGVTSKMYNADYAQEHPEEVWTGPKLVQNRLMAAKMALHLIRTTYSQHHSLCGYTGEHCGEGEHPKADIRHGRAVRYLADHPFAPSLEEIELEEIEADVD